MSEDLQVPSEVKKSRRKTAFYPVVANQSNTKPFSKSAARRESVLALGSIEHLQHYFTKTGLAAKQKPDLKGKGLVPAIGGGHLRTPSVLNGIPQLRFELPESPPAPQPVFQSFSNIVKDYHTDPEELLPSLVADLEKVSVLWGLGTSDQRGSSEPSTSPPQVDHLKPVPSIGVQGDFDVLYVLKATTNAIRSVRNYLVALPDDADDLLEPVADFRPRTISRRPEPLNKPATKKGGENDPLILIRQAALSVLAALRQIEEKYRLPMTDDSFEIQSDNGSGSARSRVPSPNDHASDDTESSASFNFSVVTVPGRHKPVSVWVDEEDGFVDDGMEEKRERWDEKLVLGGGWLYRHDVSLKDVENEREVVASYLDTVDTVLFSGDGSQQLRGWTKTLNKLRGQRRSSSRNGRSPSPQPSSSPSIQANTGLLLSTTQNLSISDAVPEEPTSPDEIDDEHLPSWAKRSEFIDDPLGRAYALLVALLPAELLHLLPSPSQPLTSTSLMTSLVSGQLLCVAYNAGVRRSRKPWGFINKTAIWDIAALEAEGDGEKGGGEGKKRWTFRRTENLRLWAAALKLRYMIPLVSLSQMTDTPSRIGTPSSSPGPASTALPNGVVPNLFDAATVAKKQMYWEEMLHDAVLLWMEAVVNERRSE